MANSTSKQKLLTGFEVTAFPADLYNVEDPSQSRFRDFMLLTVNTNSKAKNSTSAEVSKTNMKNYEDLTRGSKVGAKELFSNGSTEQIQKLRTSPLVAKPSAGLAKAGLSDPGIFGDLSAAVFRKINVAILLPMPQNVNSDYTMNYQEFKSSGILQSVLEAASSQSVDELGEKAGQAGSHLVKEIVGGLANSGGEALGNIKAMIEKSTGQVTNPRTEQLFSGVAHREFTFTYLVAVRSAQESNDLRKLLKDLRVHMHPEIDKLYWNTPSEFDIDFLSITTKGEDTQIITNPNIPLISTCALVSLQLNHSPNGFYSSMVDGSTPWVAFTLSFKELQPLHRAAIEKGY